jgi:hypothetical protein
VSNDNDTPDPLTFTLGALETLPRDPTQTTADDLATIAAMAEGLARHTLGIRGDMAALALRALDCDPAEPGVIADMVAERTRLELLELRADLADRKLTAYSRSALRAHGFNLDRLIAGDNTKE